MTTLTPVNEANIEITTGMILTEVHARRNKTFNKIVKKVTKNFIVTQDGQKYTKEGYYIFEDSGKRDLYTRLFIASEELVEEAQKVTDPQKTEESNTSAQEIMTTLTPVNKETIITVGMALVEVHARRSKQHNKTVKKVTKNLIVTQDGQKYTKDGYYIFDDSNKRDLYTRLHIEN